MLSRPPDEGRPPLIINDCHLTNCSYGVVVPVASYSSEDQEVADIEAARRAAIADVNAEFDRKVAEASARWAATKAATDDRF